jgi:hypothetical protein
MATFEGFDANQAMTRYFGMHGASLPEHTFTQVADALAGTDGLAAIINTIEALFYIRTKLTKPGWELLRDLADFAMRKNFYGYQASGRGAEIVAVAERKLAGGKSVEEGDPELDERFAPPPPEEPAEAPVEG